MKPICKIAGAVIILFLMSIADLPNLPEAQAFRGRGAAFVAGAAVGSSQSSAAEAEAAAAQQEAAAARQEAEAAKKQAAAAEQQAAAAKQEAEAAKKQAAAAPATAAGTPLPLGTVVPTLPAGCTPTAVGGVNYYYCGGNFYQAVYEGSTLKYITTKPK